MKNYALDLMFNYRPPEATVLRAAGRGFYGSCRSAESVSILAMSVTAQPAPILKGVSPHFASISPTAPIEFASLTKFNYRGVGNFTGWFLGMFSKDDIAVLTGDCTSIRVPSGSGGGVDIVGGGSLDIIGLATGGGGGLRRARSLRPGREPRPGSW
jgi:hypothetical protein